MQAEPADDSFSSSYPGVTWDKGKKKWKARIKINGKEKYLGRFTDEHEAALAWAAAKWEQEDATRTMEGWTELLVDGQAAQLKRLVALHPKSSGASSAANHSSIETAPSSEKWGARAAPFASGVSPASACDRPTDHKGGGAARSTVGRWL